jgi:hypothetical protein
MVLKLFEHYLDQCFWLFIIFYTSVNHKCTTQILAVLMSCEANCFWLFMYYFFQHLIIIGGWIMVTVYVFLLLYLLYWEKTGQLKWSKFAEKFELNFGRKRPVGWSRKMCFNLVLEDKKIALFIHWPIQCRSSARKRILLHSHVTIISLRYVVNDQCLLWYWT